MNQSLRGGSVALRRMAMPILALVLALGAIVDVVAAGKSQEVHGVSDAFAASGVAIAWAVLRAPKEEDTMVVMRIANDAAIHPACAVTGVDPFGGQSRSILAPTLTSGTLDVRIPRRLFADFPRTEVKLYTSARPSATDPPALTVFYLGVPDTTPEFASEALLRTYLDDRIARLRPNPKGKTP